MSTATLPTESVLEIAREGALLCKKLSLHQRGSVLTKASNEVLANEDILVTLIVQESGKTIRQARKEVHRCANTLLLSAEEAKRLSGEVIPFGAFEGSEKRQGYAIRQPIGIILAITPFNDPLNLVAHKLGPAIAGGNSVILKPSQHTLRTAQALVDILRLSGLHNSIISIFSGNRHEIQQLLAIRDIRMVSFTGGMETGEAITKQAGLKKMLMDLGGNAPVIVCADAQLEKAVDACVEGAFWAAGQNCIGVQRILLDKDIYSTFTDQFVAKTQQLKLGDPQQESTDVGRMINDAAAQRIETWVQEAIDNGAQLLTGHQRKGHFYSPTVLTNVPHHCKVWREEVFAPVVILQSTNTFDEAIGLANSIDYSLHAAIFTQNLESALSAADQLEAGGVMINDSSDYRFDAMPFGGFKYGGMGREGVKYALEEMTQTKVVCFNR
jgi:acyl-CoA reductase-like NAD-dependent aldehyde dehydrogenase